jgi:phosphate-selective porin OprO/OprP
MLRSGPCCTRFIEFLAILTSFASLTLGANAQAQEAPPPAADTVEEASPITDDMLSDVTDDAGPAEFDSTPDPFEALRLQHLFNPYEYDLRWENGIRLERLDGLFRLKVGARLEVDVAGIFEDQAIEDAFGASGPTEWELRRAWLTLGGTVGSRWLYKIQVDLSGNSANEDDKSAYVREIYVAAVGLGPLGTVKLGSVREPFMLNGVTSSHTLSFQERALPQAFSPSYSPGILVENHAFDSRLAWALGLFYYQNSSGDDSVPLDLTARVTGLPIYAGEGERLLHVGASYSHQFRNSFGLRYRRRPETRLSERYVDTETRESDDIDLFGVEILGIRGPLSARAEVMLSHVRRPVGADETFWSAYAEVGYILTGESRPYRKNRGVLGRLVPKNPVEWRGGGWGLFELAVRYSYLDLNHGVTRGGRLSDLGAALNWYPRAHVRLMTNYIHAWRHGIGNADIIQARLALDF